MNLRPVPLLFGVGALGGGLAILGGLVTAEATWAFAIVIGLGTLLGGVGAVWRRRSGTTWAETPDPERRYQVAVPGDDLDAVLDQFRRTARRPTTGDRSLRHGLRSAAVSVMMRFEGEQRERAEERVLDGTWTEDREAAGFLHRDSGSGPSGPPSITDPIRARLRERRRRKAVAATTGVIAAMGGVEPADEGRSRAGGEGESVAPRTTSRRIDRTEVHDGRETDQWTGVGALALFGIGAGILAQSVPALFVGAIGVGYAGVARTFDPPRPALTVERAVDPRETNPGETVAVRTTVTNEGPGAVADCRIVDGIPAGLSLESGQARVGTPLRPGESVTMEYEVTARRGHHEFDPAMVLVREPLGSRERTLYVPAQTSTPIVATPEVHPTAAPVPLREGTASFAGRLPTSESGTGVAFHAVREYRRGDPLNRIDWKRAARTGERSTIEFRRERAARVLIVVDARAAAYRGADPDGEHAVDRSVRAASRMVSRLLDDGDLVGLAGLGPLERRRFEPDADPTAEHSPTERDLGDGASTDGASTDGTSTDDASTDGATSASGEWNGAGRWGDRLAGPAGAELCWVAPGAGPDHRTALGEALASHPQFSTVPPRAETVWWQQLQVLFSRLDGETQVMLCSPLTDVNAVGIARRIDARGHPVTVLSPDPTAADTPGRQLARVARRVAQFDLRRSGIEVIDWPASESLDAVFHRASLGDRG